MDTGVVPFVAMCCCTFPSIIISAIVAGWIMYSTVLIDQLNLSPGDKLDLDWKTPFINDIYVVNEDQSCAKDDDPVI